MEYGSAKCLVQRVVLNAIWITWFLYLNIYEHHENHYNLIFHNIKTRNTARLPLQWCHNEYDGVSNHQSHDCLLNRLFKRTSKKTSKLSVSGFREGNLSDSPHRGPVTRKMFLFDDVIMHIYTFACIAVAAWVLPLKDGDVVDMSMI